MWLPLLSLLPASKLLPTLLPPHSSLQNTAHQCNANEGFNNSCPHTSWSCSPKINNLFEKINLWVVETKKNIIHKIMKYAVISSSRITEQMENFVKRQTQSVYGSKKVLLLSRIVAFFIPSYVYV